LKIAIRVDASSQIGTGHFMRCVTLADALKQRGAQICFISRHLPNHLKSMLAAKRHEFVQLNSNSSEVEAIADGLTHSHWLGVSQHADAQDSIQALSDQAWDWLIVDHYALDGRWESALRKTSKNILVIDDIADRQHDCDILLDMNYYADMESRYIDKVPTHCQFFFGPRYALLRDEFRQMHKSIKSRSGPVKRILVFFGGVDAENYTGRAIEALSKIDIPDLHVDVIIGSQHPCCEQIKAEIKQHKFICHVQTDKMAELMASADLAIGAGGGATWERCCLGLPTLTVCTAVNQQKQIADAAQEGFLCAPSHVTDWASVINIHLMSLIDNEHLRFLISSRALQAVDGRGVLRIAGVLGCSGIEIRMVNPNDSKNLFKWRNHISIRSVSMNKGLITWQDHQRWFEDVIGSEDRVLLIGQNGDAPIGVLRFDMQKDVAEVSIYLVPDANNSGQGGNLLLSGEQWIKENRPEVSYIRACVVGGNVPSQRLFLEANYQVEVTHYLKAL
jgi:UDP-2,4-diacetamido-2,4,6-trideoxy-beta-L-altropyranose hydrolase